MALGGCPSQEIPSAVTVLTSGTYNGTLDCTTRTADATGEKVDEKTSEMTVEVTATGQLYISGLPYYETVEFDGSDAATGIASNLTVTKITQNATTRTVTINGAGTTSNPQRSYATTHDITLAQTDDTHMEVTDVYEGHTATDDASFELSCGGAVTAK